MTPRMKLFQTKGRSNRTSNPCGEIFLMGSFTSPLGIAKFGTVNRAKPLATRVWKNADKVKIPLGKMSRPYLQNCLQFCHRRRAFGRGKDGYSFAEWEAMFFAMLMNPAVK